VAGMIRVDHAGEYGAMRIYEGQLAVLEARARDKNAVTAIRRMAEQESRHLERFSELVNARKVRPTALSPLWHMAGFALGAGTAMLGARAAMACTAAVEEVIDDHYARQIALTAIPNLKRRSANSARTRSPIATRRSHMAPRKRQPIACSARP